MNPNDQTLTQKPPESKPEIFSVRDVFCKPLETTQIKSEVINGLARISQKKHFELTEVVFDCPSFIRIPGGIRAGDKVYIKGEAMGTVWGTKVLTVNGQSVIVVPESEIFLVQR